MIRSCVHYLQHNPVQYKLTQARGSFLIDRYVMRLSHLFPEGPVVGCGEVGLLCPFPQYCWWYEGCLDLVEYFIE